MKKFKKLIIFDLDGTLYQLRGGSYGRSLLRQAVLYNAQKFIACHLNITQTKAGKILNTLQKKYGEDISIALEKEYAINRNDYFKIVWNIPAKGIIKIGFNAQFMLRSLKKKCKIILVSEAPLIWIIHVLQELKIQNFFRGSIFSGEGDNRKRSGNVFKQVMEKFNMRPVDCISVGDQEKTDIIPAQKIGMQTIFLSQYKKSHFATFNVKNIPNLERKLLQLLQGDKPKTSDR